MDFQAILQNLLVMMPIFLLSLSVHEAAHAAAAYYLGDPTARDLGRVTINPIPHIDPIGTLLMPILSTLMGGVAMIGWAKPVPVDWRNLRNVRRDDTIIALAGPASNVVLSVVFFVVLAMCLSGVIPATDGTFGELVLRFARYGLVINIALAVFNMIPIPPLDGSHVVANVLPYEAAEKYRSLSMYGIIILLLLLNFTPMRGFLGAAVNGVVGLYMSIWQAIG
jgi:Zn-dependent protease